MSTNRISVTASHGAASSGVPADGPLGLAPVVAIGSAAGAAAPAPAVPLPSHALWAQIASEAAAAHDEVASALAEGLQVPDVLDSIARVTSTLSWIQARVAAGPAAPADEHALDAVRAARRSIGQARGLVSGALASARPPFVVPSPAPH